MIWWDESWNPVIGCTKCSPACENCYAEALHTQRHKALLAGKKMPECYREPFGTVRFFPERLDQPMHWKKPQRIFVCNMGDLFHEDVPVTLLNRIFAVMALCPQHEFMVLTKRWKRMVDFIALDALHYGWRMPFSNVLHGATVWDQPSMDAAAKHLLKMPAGARLFLSIEPMLGPVVIPAELLARLAQVICGGETGPGARPLHPDWPRSLRDQCVGTRVPFFFKGWGEYQYEGVGEEYFDVPHVPHLSCIDQQGAQCALSRPKGDPWWILAGNDPWKYMGNTLPNGIASMVRVGKARAGRALDGRTWEEVPHA